MRFLPGLISPLVVVVVFFTALTVHCGPTTVLESSLRLADAEDLVDLRRAVRPLHISDIPKPIMSTGLPLEYLHGITPKGRVVFTAPQLHGHAYQIPSAHHGFVEYLVPNGEDKTLRSIGWGQAFASTKIKEHSDLAFSFDKDRYLLVDNVPLSRFAGVKSEYAEGDLLREPYPSPGIKMRYTGIPVLEQHPANIAKSYLSDKAKDNYFTPGYVYRDYPSLLKQRDPNEKLSPEDEAMRPLYEGPREDKVSRQGGQASHSAEK